MMEKISGLFFWRNPKYIKGAIKNILSKAQRHSLIDASSREMIENILEFSSILVREIMIPRTEIIAVNNEAGIDEIIKEAMESKHTRIPVYRGSIDNIIGIMNVKDLLKFCSKNTANEDISQYLTKPYYIPETKNAHLLFYEFKENKKHIAIVIDEYGGTSGLVTLEDLLEEIVGDIRDEHEISTPADGIYKTTDGSIVVDGRTEIEIIEDYLKIVLEKGRYETLSGLILNKTRRIPLTGENFKIEGLDITIENADERSIKKIKIKKMEINTSNE